MDGNQLRKMQVAGIYKDAEVTVDDNVDDQVRDKVDELEGLSKGYTDDIHTVLEMHVDLDQKALRI